MAAFLIRRAFPSPVAHLATRSARSFPVIPPAVVSSSYVLFGSRFLPFSTSSSNNPCGEIPNKTPAVSYHNTFEKFKEDVDRTSNGLPVPSGYPFSLDYFGNVASLSRSYGTKEMVVISIDGDDPLIPMDVEIRTGFVTVSAKMTAKPGQLDISQVNVRDRDANMGSYRDYLQTKGITPETISFLYRLLGYNQKRT